MELLKHRVYREERPILNLVVALLVYFLIQQIVAWIAVLTVYSGTVAEDAVLWINIISGIIQIFSSYVLFFDNQYMEDGPKQSLGWAALLGCSLCVGLNVLISITHLNDLFPSYSELSEQVFVGSLPLELLMVGVIAPLEEELLFRGILYKGLRRKMSPLLAVICSAILFGAVHMNMVQFVYATLMGLFLAWVYETYRSIWAPVLVHGVANAVSVLLTEVEIVQEIFSSTIGIVLTYLLIAGMVLIPKKLYRGSRKEFSNVSEN